MAHSTVALKNVRGPKLHAVTLIHAYYCEKGAVCQCQKVATVASSRNAKTGIVARRHTQRVQHASLTLPLGVEVCGLHPAILNVPGISSAIQSGMIVAREVLVPEADAKPKTELKSNPKPKPAPVPAPPPVPAVPVAATEVESTETPESKPAKKDKDEDAK